MWVLYVYYRLARIKNEARRKREEREKAAELKKAEKTRRQTALEMQFCDWTEKDEGRVEMALVCSFIYIIAFTMITVTKHNIAQ